MKIPSFRFALPLQGISQRIISASATCCAVADVDDDAFCCCLALAAALGCDFDNLCDSRPLPFPLLQHLPCFCSPSFSFFCCSSSSSAQHPYLATIMLIFEVPLMRISPLFFWPLFRTFILKPAKPNNSTLPQSLPPSLPTSLLALPLLPIDFYEPKVKFVELCPQQRDLS